MENKIRYPALYMAMVNRNEHQTTLSRLLNISAGSVSNKMTGRSDWTKAQVDKLCEHYQMNYYDLFKTD